MFCRIGENISLDLFYFVNLTSSCSLIPWTPLCQFTSKRQEAIMDQPCTSAEHIYLPLCQFTSKRQEAIMGGPHASAEIIHSPLLLFVPRDNNAQNLFRLNLSPHLLLFLLRPADVAQHVHSLRLHQVSNGRPFLCAQVLILVNTWS